jgi:hypothetical protein
MMPSWWCSVSPESALRRVPHYFTQPSHGDRALPPLTEKRGKVAVKLPQETVHIQHIIFSHQALSMAERTLRPKQAGVLAVSKNIDINWLIVLPAGAALD